MLPLISVRTVSMKDLSVSETGCSPVVLQYVHNKGLPFHLQAEPLHFQPSHADIC